MFSNLVVVVFSSEIFRELFGLSVIVVKNNVLLNWAAVEMMNA